MACKTAWHFFLYHVQERAAWGGVETSGTPSIEGSYVSDWSWHRGTSWAHGLVYELTDERDTLNSGIEKEKVDCEALFGPLL